MYQRKVFERYLKVEEERELLRTVARFGDVLARRDHAWMRYARQTGVRVSVLAGLTVADARRALREKYLFVRAEINKGEQSYTIFQTKRALAALRDLLKVRRDMGYAEQAEAPLIMSRNRRGMSIRSYEARMRRWCEAAGLNVAASPHWFRHTLGKRIMQQSTAKDPRGVAQRALGHGSLRSTEIYTFPDREDYEQGMEEAS